MPIRVIGAVSSTQISSSSTSIQPSSTSTSTCTKYYSSKSHIWNSLTGSPKMCLLVLT